MISSQTIHHNTFICQENNKINEVYLKLCLFYLLNGKSKAAPKVLNTLFSYMNCHENVFPSHEKLAKEAGVSPRHTERLTSEFQAVGIIKKVKRPYSSCIFYFNNAVNSPWIREMFAPYIKAFRYLPLIMLTSSYLAPASTYEPDGGVLYYINKYVFKQSGCNGRYGCYLRHPDVNNHTTKRVVESCREKKGLSSMETKQINLIPSYVEQCKAFNLSMNGKIELSVFPEQALKHALGVVSNKQFKADKAKFFYMRKVAVAYCMREGYKLYYDRLVKVREYYEVAASDDYLLGDVVPSSSSRNKEKSFPKREEADPFAPSVDIETRKATAREKYREHPVIEYAKVFSMLQVNPDAFAGEEPRIRPDYDVVEATKMIEDYKKTNACRRVEYMFGFTLLNPYLQEKPFFADEATHSPATQPAASDNASGSISPVDEESEAYYANDGYIEEEYPDCEVELPF